MNTTPLNKRIKWTATTFVLAAILTSAACTARSDLGLTTESVEQGGAESAQSMTEWGSRTDVDEPRPAPTTAVTEEPPVTAGAGTPAPSSIDRTRIANRLDIPADPPPTTTADTIRGALRYVDTPGPRRDTYIAPDAGIEVGAEAAAYLTDAIDEQCYEMEPGDESCYFDAADGLTLYLRVVDLPASRGAHGKQLTVARYLPFDQLGGM